MKRLTLLCILSLFILLTVAATAQMPGAPSFSADMSMTQPREHGMKGKMYMGGGKMRMDMSSEGGKMSIISDPAKKISYMVMHDQQMYMEINAEGGMGPMNPMARGPKMPEVKQLSGNPCGGSTGVTCKMTGSEMMNGRMCDKWEFASASKSEAGTVWIDQKTRWPIKSVHGDGTMMEFTNFQEGPQDAGLFVPPSSYKKFDMGGMMRRQ